MGSRGSEGSGIGSCSELGEECRVGLGSDLARHRHGTCPLIDIPFPSLRLQENARGARLKPLIVLPAAQYDMFLGLLMAHLIQEPGEWSMPLHSQAMLARFR